jgi:hypothetical protein
MKVSKENRDMILDWLKAKCGNLRCMCCGNGKWNLSDISMIHIGFDLDSTRFHYHEGMPAVAIVCDTCGHIEFFASGVLGIKPKAPEIEETKILEPDKSEAD